MYVTLFILFSDTIFPIKVTVCNITATLYGAYGNTDFDAAPENGRVKVNMVS